MLEELYVLYKSKLAFPSMLLSYCKCPQRYLVDTQQLGTKLIQPPGRSTDNLFRRSLKVV